ncbi:biotin-dependent carboxyltransferase family protein [Aminivibrio sp.]|uniref:5-oxoprolinase subunit C family protein n=1 Tax=Aminivibrio sp. TaxID=1872489 RepID=UPI001A4D320C|nr:biotin-dependent carboxyltransferase family protein [Aminivibrio sp.]MBL3539860.1 biotin-dependent carboxyltransferase family protein [Aminivibrio sp.]
MSALVLECRLPGMFTTVQDSGRWGYQGKGMPVAGAMDLHAFRLGNILAGNDENDAALEVTLLGPTLFVAEGEGIVAVTGADLGFQVNGRPAPLWAALAVKVGDTLSFSGPRSGCRAYLCFSGGIDVPVVMESRSTYTRALVGGFQGRALKKGDSVRCGEPLPLWRRCEGLVCPEGLRPAYSPDAPLRVVPGPQDDLFTDKGKETFYGSEYSVSNSADRMGYRLDGPEIEHAGGADIISDAVPLGAVQVPGHRQPIVMLADRQTTGGYAKIGVVCSVDIAALSQRLPGQKVRFQKISLDDALALAREEAGKRDEMRRLRALWRSAPKEVAPEAADEGAHPFRGEALIRVDGEEHRISWEEIREVE